MPMREITTQCEHKTVGQFKIQRTNIIDTGMSHMSLVMWKPVLPYSNNKGADQPMHPRSLISTFVVRSLDSMIPVLAISEISRLLICFCSWAGRFESYLVANPEDRFSRDDAHMNRMLWHLLSGDLSLRLFHAYIVNKLGMQMLQC